MEEFHGSASALTGRPEDREAPAPLDAGRLGGFLCELQRQRFDGVLHVKYGEHSAALGFREGTPVSFDDPTPGHTLGEQLIERGQLTRTQCNSVLAHMTDGLVEDEAVAFFEHAVQLGFLTDADANVELSSRVRARMIQLFAWRGCETTLEAGTAALLGRRELPQNLGAILYMGVRTFYDEEFLASIHPDLAHTFVRLTAAPATIAHHFGLDDEEFQLLRRIHPAQSLSQLFSDPRVDRVHVLGLLLLMRISQLCEVSSGPFAQKPSPRAASPKQREGSYAGPMPDEPAPGPQRSRAGSYAGPMPDEPAPSTQRSSAGSYAGPMPNEPAPSTQRGRAGSYAGPMPNEPAPSSQRSSAGSYAGPMPNEPAQKPQRTNAGSHAGALPKSVAPPPLPGKTGSSVGPLPELFEPGSLPGSNGSAVGPLPDEPNPQRGKAGSSVGPLPDPPAPRPAAKPNVDVTQEALLEAAARTARMRRSLSPSRRNSKLAEPPPAAPAATSGARSPSETPAPGAPANTQQQPAQKPAQAADARGDYAKAHLKELIARRKQAANVSESSAPSARDTARELREARSLLHAQNYTRAERILALLLEIEPLNEVFKTYHLWASWRAQPEAVEPQLDELQELAKKLLTQPEHGAFAAYVLGHVFLHHKRDDLAEKFFKRAHATDRTNKDAERHLLILERRKQAAAEGGASVNRKLFGIQLPNSKPKP